MTSKTANEVSINAQYIKDMSLEVPNAPEIFTKLNTQPQLGVELNVDVKNLSKDNFEVTLNLRINADVEKEKLFILELAFAAACTVKLPEDKIEPVLFIEIPQLLFPYARQIVSSNLANASLPPLLLTPVDFVAVYQSRKAAEKNAKPN
jgi:preprotein translocase subunit SecB